MTRSAARLAAISLLLLASAAFAGSAGAGATASLRVIPHGQTVEYTDGSFTVSIWIIGIDHHGSISYDDDRNTVPDREEPSEGLGAYEFTLTYDPAVVEATGAAAGTFLASTGRGVQCLGRVPEAGQYVVGCISNGAAAGPQGAGQLAEVTFRPLATGISALTLDAELAGPLSDDIPISIESGLVVVQNGPPPPTPRPDGRTPTPSPTASSPPLTVVLPEDGSPAHVPVSLGEVPHYLRPGGSNASGEDGSTDPTSGPVAGTGYQTRETPVVFVVLGAAMAAGGAGLLGAGWRLQRRAKR